LEKMKIRLIDNLSVHSVDAYGYRSFTPFVEPSLIEWVEDEREVAVFTDRSLDSDTIRNIDSDMKVGWLVECRSVHPMAYEKVIQVEDQLDYIFTFDEQLLARGEKYVKNLIGTSRIIQAHAGIYKKSKLVSLIASEKTYCEGHSYRHQIVNQLKEKHPIDLWGRAYKAMPEGFKALALAEYGFSIVVENSKYKDYFTEKIVDCFRTGTVPIYWGCENIQEYFDMDGIIVFNSIPELDDILGSITLEDYKERLGFVINNFELANKWISMDDTLATNLREKINEQR